MSFAACGRRSCDAVKIGPSLAKIPLDALLTLTVARRALVERATTRSTRTKKAALIGVVLAALLRVPHLYDMHSSLPQQLTNFAFSRSRLIAPRVPRARAAHDPPIARRDRHLPVARGDGAGRSIRARAPC